MLSLKDPLIFQGSLRPKRQISYPDLSAGTDLVDDLYPGAASSSPESFVDGGPGIALFVASTPDLGRELVRLDLASGVPEVLDLALGGVGSSPAALTAGSQGVFFTADTPAADPGAGEQARHLAPVGVEAYESRGEGVLGHGG